MYPAWSWADRARRPALIPPLTAGCAPELVSHVVVLLHPGVLNPRTERGVIGPTTPSSVVQAS